MKLSCSHLLSQELSTKLSKNLLAAKSQADSSSTSTSLNQLAVYSLTMLAVVFSLLIGNFSVANAANAAEPPNKPVNNSTTNAAKQNIALQNIADSNASESVISEQVLYLQPEVNALIAAPKSTRLLLIEKLTLRLPELNAAEQFIVLQAQAERFWQLKKLEQAQTLLRELDKRALTLAPEQAAQSPFIDYLRIWSLVLTQQQLFEQAYEIEKKYLKAYSKSFATTRKQEIALLNEKYETSRKETENELLEKRAETTRLKIAEAEQEKAFYQRNKLILMAIIVVFIGMLIRQITISRRLNNLSKKDQLTGCHSRGQLFVKGNRLIEHFERTGNSFCIVMFDINNFKAFNEQFSHDQGDAKLQQLTKIASQILRSRDVLARIGSEKFVVLLPSATLVQTQAIAERIKEKAFSKAELSLSVGLVCIEQTAGSLNSALQSADTARRHAKATGSKKVISFVSINAD